MRTLRTLALFSLAAILLPSASAFAADDLKSVLLKLDAAASRFHSTSADFQFVTEQTDPIPDKDTQTGTVYYNRKGTGFEMAAHIKDDNGKPVPKIIVVSGGEFKMYEKLTNQLTTSKKVRKYENYLVLGFGASGSDLEQKWSIKFLGDEMMNGVKVAKLELVAREPEVVKLFPMVTIWIDTERGVSLKQFFDEGQGQSRTCTYSNIKLNEPLPSEAFRLPTDSKTQYIAQ